MKLGQVAIEVVANAGVAGDAERRTLLVLVSSVVLNAVEIATVGTRLQTIITACISLCQGVAKNPAIGVKCSNT